MAIISEIRLKDNYTKTAKKIESSLNSVQNAFKKTEGEVKKAERSMGAVKKALDRTYQVKIEDVKSKKIRDDIVEMKKNLDKATGKAYEVKVTAKTTWADKIKGNVEQVRGKLDGLRQKAVDFKVGVVGFAGAIKQSRSVAKALKETTGRKHKVAIGLEGSGGVLGVLDNIKGKLAGLGKGVGGALKVGGMAAIAGGTVLASAGLVGGKKLLSAGSELEQQQISMTHFLGGDKTKSAGYISQLRKEANKTPFGTQEVIGAGTRAIQIAEGDTGKAMELVKMSEDMAALTPGKTISDAMEALADAWQKKYTHIGRQILILLWKLIPFNVII